MNHGKPKPTSTNQAQEAAKAERHPKVPDHAADDTDPGVPGGNRPDAAVAEDPKKPSIIDKSRT